MRTFTAWFCNTCNKAVAHLLKMLTDVTNKQDKFKEELESIDKRLEHTERVVEDLSQDKAKLLQLEAKVEEMKGSVVLKEDVVYNTKIEKLIEDKIDSRLNDKSKQSVLFSEVVAKQVEQKFESVNGEVLQVQQQITEAKERVEEDKDREARSNNIIIYRMAESDSNLREDCKKHDEDFVFKLVNDVLEVDLTEGDVKAMFRLGKKGDTCRPFMLQVREKMTKNRIMESLYRLRSADDRFRSISIVHDMTARERADCKQLVEEAKAKQLTETGNFMWRVRGAPGQMKVVKIKQSQNHVH